MLTLSTPLSSLAGVGPRFAARFKRLGIETVRDLLYHFPARYEDFSHVYRIADLEPGQQATIQGVVRSVELHRTWRKHMMIVEATIEDDSGAILAVWFNQPYVKNVLREGTLANFSGKVSSSDGELQLHHPTYELLRNEERMRATAHTARLVPIYPETQGLTSKGIRYCIQPILSALPQLEEWIPPQVRFGGLAQTNADITRTDADTMHRQNAGIPEINKALRDIHFPETLDDALNARRRFEFENLFLLQLVNLGEKMKLRKNRAPAVPVDIEEMKRVIGALPFELTFSQKRSLWEILQDMAKPSPMNRLLQGDVGSGKTVIAALSALAAARAGCATAIMAPTEVLARQHYATFKKLFASLSLENEPPFALVIGAQAKAYYADDAELEVKKAHVQAALKKGEIKIVIGTHALISGGKKSPPLAFPKLGLVIVDEQHRFGISQRARLGGASSSSSLVPHFLSMSATPIPRTLTLTIFGDLDVSTITEMPSGRKKIVTKIVSPENRMKAYQFIRAEIRKERQAFVICPRIEPEEEKEETANKNRSWFKTLELKSVKEEYEKLSKTIFPDLQVAMLHGQLKADEKEKIMAEFHARKTDVLVSTSVIEVGVDVPNASIMMIEGSERFGLAQLYQFRGRVGRGEHQSYCFLFTDSSGKTAQARLKAIVEAKNGFELAERDLAIRGPGEFIGDRQTGFPDYLMRGIQDPELVRASRAAALGVLETDGGMEAHPALKEQLKQFEARLHLE